MELEYSLYTSQVVLENNIHVLIRPIRPDDSIMEKEFIERLSPESGYDRFFGYMIEPSEEMLGSLCNIDYETQMALVAVLQTLTKTKFPMIIGVGRIIKSTNDRAELAVVVADQYQHLGLGTKLTEMLLTFARKKRFTSVYAVILPDNFKMIRMLTKLGFKIRYPGPEVVVAERSPELSAQ